MRDRRRAKSTASLRHERQYQRAGCKVIVGIDEAGRGPLAGPVAAAAVALPLVGADLAAQLSGIRDSKDMTRLQREESAETIRSVALAWGIGHSGVPEIDQLGIVGATQRAMERALDQALAGGDLRVDCLFIDYMLLPARRDIPQVSIVEGDKRSLSIACASVLAKVWRDAYMRRLDARFPGYGFAKHKGYGTEAHLRALDRYGPCDAHRRSFKPVRRASCRNGA